MRKIKILITGLCLSRNRGGAAMALSFIDQIKKYVPSEFTFAVDPNHINLEKYWGDHYSVRVIPMDTLWMRFITLFPFRLLRLGKHLFKSTFRQAYEFNRLWKNVHKQTKIAFAEADCIINMNGIGFVGDGTRELLSAIDDFTSSTYAKLSRKPFYRFIQSYGPFEDWRVSLLAKNEFKRLPCVMARGEISAKACSKIVKKVPVYSYPDIAITLSRASDKWITQYLNKKKFKIKDYVVLSPSSVMVSLQDNKSTSFGSEHISVYRIVAEKLISHKQKIFFVPHNTSPDSRQCDRIVCKNILQQLSDNGVDTSDCRIVTDELDCFELKSIIAQSKMAIVSRYHALVAALSTGVPAITIGWNAKYQDLLTFYKSDEFAVDARIGDANTVVCKVFDKIDNWSEQKISELRNCQIDLEKQLHKAVKQCSEWIIEHTQNKNELDFSNNYNEKIQN